MSGFVIEICNDSSPGNLPPLQLVSLGKGESLRTYSSGSIRALWSRWPESRQHFVGWDGGGNLLWIEGQPDRLPINNESLGAWLPGRWGSFRGFEIDGQAMTVTIFGDPLGTRPIFYLATPKAFYISDKLATLVANAQERAEINWGALLEALIVGALYSEDTTLVGAEQLSPGVALCIGKGRVYAVTRNEMPHHKVVEPQQVLDDPAGTLLNALRCAVEEVWVDPEASLLLTGGLDSRITLSLAGPGRKALTVTTRENRESRIARRIAQTCGAEFLHVPRPYEHYHQIVRDSDLIGAAMYYPYHAHMLHMASDWRLHGVPGLAHAFLCCALLKGAFLLPDQIENDPPTFLDGLETRVSPIVRRTVLRNVDGNVDRIYELLSEEGKYFLRERLAGLSEIFHSRYIDGLETALERKVISRISRHAFYPLLLGWIEEQDVHSPIFHPAIWSWHHASRICDRYQAKAFLRALQKVGPDIYSVPDSNTGRPPIGMAPRLDIWNHSLVRLVISAGRAFIGLGPEDHRSGPPMGPIFRLPGGKALLEEGLAELEKCFLFDPSGLQAVFSEYVKGNNRVTVTMLALVGASRWIARVRKGVSA